MDDEVLEVSETSGEREYSTTFRDFMRVCGCGRSPKIVRRNYFGNPSQIEIPDPIEVVVSVYNPFFQ